MEVLFPEYLPNFGQRQVSDSLCKPRWLFDTSRIIFHISTALAHVRILGSTSGVWCLRISLGSISIPGYADPGTNSCRYFFSDLSIHSETLRRKLWKSWLTGIMIKLQDCGAAIADFWGWSWGKFAGEILGRAELRSHAWFLEHYVLNNSILLPSPRL